MYKCTTPALFSRKQSEYPSGHNDAAYGQARIRTLTSKFQPTIPYKLQQYQYNKGNKSKLQLFRRPQTGARQLNIYQDLSVQSIDHVHTPLPTGRHVWTERYAGLAGQVGQIRDVNLVQGDVRRWVYGDRHAWPAAATGQTRFRLCLDVCRKVFTKNHFTFRILNID